MIDASKKKKQAFILSASPKTMVSSIRNRRPRRRSRPRRMVSFSDDGYDDNNINTLDITICYVPSLSDLSEAEIKSIWYTQVEFRNMKKSCVKVLRKMIAGTLSFDSNEEEEEEDDDDDDTVKNKELDHENQNQNEEDEEETTRGLENKTPRGSKARQKNRFIAMDAVLDEQQRTWEQGKRNVDYEYIALLYHQSSVHCQEKAYLIGKKDAKVVHNYHHHRYRYRHRHRHHQDENERSICVVDGKDNANDKHNKERKESVKNIVTDDKRRKKDLPSSLSPSSLSSPLSPPLPTTHRPSAAAYIVSPHKTRSRRLLLSTIA
jgi:hypothetical protein